MFLMLFLLLLFNCFHVKWIDRVLHLSLSGSSRMHSFYDSQLNLYISPLTKQLPGTFALCSLITE